MIARERRPPDRINKQADDETRLAKAPLRPVPLGKLAVDQ